MVFFFFSDSAMISLIPADAGALVLAFSEPNEKYALRRACRTTARWPCTPDTVAVVSFVNRGPFLSYGKWERTPPGESPLSGGGWWREHARMVWVTAVPYGPKRRRTTADAAFTPERGGVVLPGQGCWGWLPILFPRAAVVVVPRQSPVWPPPAALGVELVWDILHDCPYHGNGNGQSNATVRALRAHVCATGTQDGLERLDRAVTRILPGPRALVDLAPAPRPHPEAEARVPPSIKLSAGGWPPSPAADGVVIGHTSVVRPLALAERSAMRATTLFLRPVNDVVEGISSVDWPRLRDVTCDAGTAVGAANVMRHCFEWALQQPTVTRVVFSCWTAGAPKSAAIALALHARAKRGCPPVRVELRCRATNFAWLARQPGVALESVTLQMRDNADETAAVLDALEFPAVQGALLLVELYGPQSVPAAKFDSAHRHRMLAIAQRNPQLQFASIYAHSHFCLHPSRLARTAALL